MNLPNESASIANYRWLNWILKDFLHVKMFKSCRTGNFFEITIDNTVKVRNIFLNNMKSRGKRVTMRKRERT